MRSAPADPAKSAAVRQRAEAAGVRYVYLQFVDILGVLKSVTIPVAALPEAIEQGKWFDGSALENFARVAESDMYLIPDLDTFQIIPWERGGAEAEPHRTARLICDVYTPRGDPFPGDARHALRRAIDEAAKLGFDYLVGPEVEFFLFRRAETGAIEPVAHDVAGYFDLSTDRAVDVRREMVSAIEAMGVRVDTAHHEVAAGQHEIDFAAVDALAGADHTITCRHALKAIAHAHGLHATFMPKPLSGVNGSGMHTHQSLVYRDGSGNAFYDPTDEYGLSETARHFLAGQLAHARGMCAILAPLVNSYKRLIPGYEAPVRVSWGRVNQSALLRIPRTAPEKSASTRIELRCPDPACNPYLAFAVMLHAGLDGIRRRLPLPPPREENLFAGSDVDRTWQDVPSLPISLGEALRDLEQDDLVRRALGDHICDSFIEAKTIEWTAYRTTVSPWETQRYLELY